MTTRTGPAAHTRNYQAMQSDGGLSSPMAERDANNYVQHNVQRDDAVSVYNNDTYEGVRPLSPTPSMYLSAQNARAISRSPSNVELSFNAGVQERPTSSAVPHVTAPVSSGSEAGICALLAAMDRFSSNMESKMNTVQQQCSLQQLEMQSKLHDLTEIVNTLTRASQNDNVNALEHANAPCIGAIAVEEMAGDYNGIMKNKASQGALIGNPAATQEQLNYQRGNMHAGNALQGTNEQGMPLHVTAQNSMGAGRDIGSMLMQNDACGSITVPRAMQKPNVHTAQHNDAMMHVKAVTGSTLVLMSRVPTVTFRVHLGDIRSSFECKFTCLCSVIFNYISVYVWHNYGLASA